MPSVDLLLTNARVLTCAPSRPAASAVALTGDRIAWVGEAQEAARLLSPARTLDCQGKTLLPGFIDAHIHLFAYAADLQGVDCSPRAVRSIADILAAIRRRAAELPRGAWIRAWGFEDFHLAERRPPTGKELDAAAPHHPVKLTHRSGHASVLNSLALAQLGITNDTPEPEGATIERDPATGDLTGYLLEMEHLLSGRAPAQSSESIEASLLAAERRLLSYGVTSIHEATPTRAFEQWQRFAALKGRGRLPLRIYKMFAPADLPELLKRDMSFGSGDPGLSVGAIKMMLNETGERLLPAQEILEEQVYAAHSAGFQAAFHAAEERGVQAALEAVQKAIQRSAQEAADIASLGMRVHDHRHRVEHCGICPPPLAHRLAKAAILVVTQPAFIAAHGERYLAQIPQDKQAWLYAVKSLQDAGVRLAFGSDCPIVSPEPLRGIAAAVTRTADSGRTVGAREAVSLEAALTAYTRGAAYASADESLKGVIAQDLLADLVLLSEDLSRTPVARLADVTVEKTILGGSIVWER